ncbi:GAF domain-containing sensor histidine kinase [Couchioplanes azureus]|uniref:GAF domain-containing sensor histidine kinase n=1 Tax=Couchioplanes caeruleus TaxID=56438 RepID=UPI0016702B72|nr:GAF domain-containing sensor histidine kinase [Couchioplanes caeruleus]GGQ75649.1 sensor histidine kinase [Couchioplanes caeruleus subsp. azureus]
MDPATPDRDALVAAAARWVTREPALTVVLTEVARLLTEALGADGCLAFLVENGGDLVLAASHPAPVTAGAPLRLPAGFGIAGRVAAEGTPVALVDDHPRHPRHRELLGLSPGQPVSRLYVPARLAGGPSTAVLALHSRTRREFGRLERDAAQRVADLVGLRAYVAAALTTMREHRDEWDAVVASAVAAQEAERRRVAADLHDGVTQAIASLSFHLSAADVALGDGDVGYVAEQVTAARSLADLALGETRSAITGLHSPVLDDQGLAAGLAAMARGVRGPRIEVDATDFPLPGHVSTSLFRIAQESVQNVVKHAGAGRAVIRLTRHGHMVMLRITDDGTGFDVPGSPGFDVPGSPGSGYGLRTMAERVHLLGGRLRIESRPGAGTTVEVTVPNVC